ncbi:MAG: hypothetical protein GX103_07815 [Bacteroidales bacterium]|nr:hypothetical protein [Bacteroidales bacterium]
MRNPDITLADDTYRGYPVVSLHFEKDYTLIGKQFPGHHSLKAMEIYSVGIRYHIRQSFKSTVFPNRAEICFSKKELDKIINPLHDFG